MTWTLIWLASKCTPHSGVAVKSCSLHLFPDENYFLHTQQLQT